MNEMVKNESKDANLQWMHTVDRFQQIAETVVCVEDGQLWNQKGSLDPRTQSWLEIAGRVSGLRILTTDTHELVIAHCIL